MNRKTFRLIAAFVALLLTTLACSFSASTANVQDATLARDAEGNEATTTFSPEDTFYLIVELANAPDDSVTRAVWTAVNVEGTEPNLEIDSAELEQGTGTLTFNLENQNLWPAGQYKVDLYLNDELERTLEFQVAP